jgi:hypothetical protein
MEVADARRSGSIELFSWCSLCLGGSEPQNAYVVNGSPSVWVK